MKLQYITRKPHHDEYIADLTLQEMNPIFQELLGISLTKDTIKMFVGTGCPTFLIRHKKRNIGYFNYLLSEGISPKVMHVSSLIVDPKHQRHGVGKTVMAHIEDEARRMGVGVLEVFVQINNKRCLEFTKKLGFSEASRPWNHTIAFRKQIAVNT